jgi:hypothetical protein
MERLRTAIGIGVALLAPLLVADTTRAVAAEEQPKVVRLTAVGQVIAREDRSQTVVIRSELGGKEWIVGARVTPETTIERRSGTARYTDVAVGDRVRVQYERKPDEQAGRALVLTVLANGPTR